MKQTKSGKSEIILNTLSPYDSKVQRYLSLSKEIEQLMNNAKDENEGCVSIELGIARRTLSGSTKEA